MPKKSVRRGTSPKSRTRRPPPKPSATRSVNEPPNGIAAVIPEERSRPVSSRTAASPRSSASTRRRPPVTAVNYDYLRRDIRMLAILAPTMVVIVVILSFFVR